jgi:hypothetical protein
MALSSGASLLCTYRQTLGKFRFYRRASAVLAHSTKGNKQVTFHGQGKRNPTSGLLFLHFFEEKSRDWEVHRSKPNADFSLSLNIYPQPSTAQGYPRIQDL